MAQFTSCLKKQKAVIEAFASCKTPQQKYEKIIAWGREQKPLDPRYKIAENLVKGCQSRLYLHSYWQDDVLCFEIESDAIISSGLALLLIKIYNHETPETVLQCPPDCIEQLGISASLTPGRANGLASLHLRMKQDALKLLLERQKQKD